MKKNKNVLIILGLAAMIACAGLFSACSGETTSASTTKSQEPQQVSPWFEQVRTQGNFAEWCDTETGVHYILYSDWSANGYAGGLVMRCNADGTPYICKTNK